MARYRCTPGGGAQHCGSGGYSHIPRVLPALLVLALLVSASAPSAVVAQDAPTQLCGSCHNPDGNSTIPKYPKLAGQDAAYFTKQIRDFKSRKRIDEVMSPMAEGVSEADIENLAAYYSKQKRTPGVVTDRALAAQGQLIYDEGIDRTGVPACAGCHEKDGSGWKKIPALAGQHAAYLIKQMNDFRSGRRKNDGRMRAVARRMEEQEIAAVAEYIAGLKGE